LKMNEVMNRELAYMTESIGKNMSADFGIRTWDRVMKVGRKNVKIPTDVVGYTRDRGTNPLSVGDLRDIRKFIDNDIIVRFAVDEGFGETHFICMSCIAKRGNCYDDIDILKRKIHRIKE